MYNDNVYTSLKGFKMIRTQIYLTEQEHSKLGVLSHDLGLSQSALIREAIDLFLQNKIEMNQERESILKKAKGLWKNRKDLPDFDNLRKEWDRKES